MDIKIVAVTADVTVMNREKCKEAGFDAFLEKPIQHSKLDKILADTMNGEWWWLDSLSLTYSQIIVI